VKPTNVETRRLDSMLTEAGVKPGFEFMTIDIEGHELSALRGLSLEYWKPKLLIIESNAGAIDARIHSMLSQAGFVRYLTTGVNAWYRHESFVPPKGVWAAAGVNKIRLATAWATRQIYRAIKGNEAQKR
jgi:hypothetical protein